MITALCAIECMYCILHKYNIVILIGVYVNRLYKLLYMSITEHVGATMLLLNRETN